MNRSRKAIARALGAFALVAVAQGAWAAGPVIKAAIASDASQKFATAWRQGNAVMAQYWLDRGADINCAGCSSDGRTPLMASALDPRDKDGIGWLLDRGAAVNARDGKGRTALFYTAEGAWSVHGERGAHFSQLLDRGADPSAQDASGNTVLHVLATTPPPPRNTTGWGERELREMNANFAAFIIRLQRGGADINAANRQGDTPLAVLATKCQYEQTLFLLKQGADLNRANAAGLKPLDLAIDAATRTNSEQCNAVASLLSDPSQALKAAEANAVGSTNASAAAAPATPSQGGLLGVLQKVNQGLKNVNEALGAVAH